MRFKQIIFPPKPKVAALPIQNSYGFDWWIIGSIDKVLWAKCPKCYFTYEIMNVYNEALTRKNLREFEPFYFRKIIRECPNACTHPEESCQPISSK